MLEKGRGDRRRVEETRERLRKLDEGRGCWRRVEDAGGE